MQTVKRGTQGGREEDGEGRGREDTECRKFVSVTGGDETIAKG